MEVHQEELRRTKGRRMADPDQFKEVARALSALNGASNEPLRFDVTLDSGKKVSIMDREQYEGLMGAADELKKLKEQGRILPEPPMTAEDLALIEQMMRDE